MVINIKPLKTCPTPLAALEQLPEVVASLGGPELTEFIIPGVRGVWLDSIIRRRLHGAGLAESPTVIGVAARTEDDDELPSWALVLLDLDVSAIVFVIVVPPEIYALVEDRPAT
jgi:hypothetical protein